MGYTIIIGESYFEDSDPEMKYWSCIITEDSYAPAFAEDAATHTTNCRKPKYSEWTSFLRRTGLYDLFMNEDDGLMRKHPGIETLTEKHYTRINEAYLIFSAIEDTSDANAVDADFVRLKWLRFWVRWALDNCQNPSIYND